MFGLTKQEKLKKLLIKNTSISNELYTHYIKSLEDTTEIGQLITSQAKLDLDNVAFLYDELKQGYTELTTVTHQSDVWKLSKPQMSKGVVLTVSAEIKPDVKEIPLSLVSFHTYLEQHTVYQQQIQLASPLVASALRLKLQKSNMQLAIKIFGETSLNPATVLPFYFLYKTLLNFNSNSNIIYLTLQLPRHCNKELLNKVAELTNTNIIIGL